MVLDNPSNTPVGSFAVGNTGGWSSWETVPANITETTGTHTVYLEFVSGATRQPAVRQPALLQLPRELAVSVFGSPPAAFVRGRRDFVNSHARSRATSGPRGRKHRFVVSAPLPHCTTAVAELPTIRNNPGRCAGRRRRAPPFQRHPARGRMDGVGEHGLRPQSRVALAAPVATSGQRAPAHSDNGQPRLRLEILRAGGGMA